MPATITLEIPAEREALVRRLLALHEELDHLALTAPDGTVFDACETALLEKSRDLQTQILADTVARRIETAEKRGLRSAPARAVNAKKTADPNPANSSAPSA